MGVFWVVQMGLFAPFVFDCIVNNHSDNFGYCAFLLFRLRCKPFVHLWFKPHALLFPHGFVAFLVHGIIPFPGGIITHSFRLVKGLLSNDMLIIHPFALIVNPFF